jgi:hypothetical protein
MLVTGNQFGIWACVMIYGHFESTAVEIALAQHSAAAGGGRSCGSRLAPAGIILRNLRLMQSAVALFATKLAYWFVSTTTTGTVARVHYPCNLARGPMRD